MNEGLIPNRYAKALYKYAAEQKATESVYGEMKKLEHGYATEDELAKTVENPFLPLSDRLSLLLSASGAEPEGCLSRFFKLVFSHHRETFIRQMALAYGRQYREENGIAQVEITTASVLPDAVVDRIKAAVQASLKGKNPEYSERTDASLVGGFTVRVDSLLLDASVSSELRKLRLKLLSKK